MKWGNESSVVRIEMPYQTAAAYTSRSQRARVVSEGWADRNLYCPSCVSDKLEPCPRNTRAIDFTCPECESPFQLKSQSLPFASRIVDAAYEAMRQSIVANRTPNLFVLQYNPISWKVRNLILVPCFAFSLSFIERRRPLSSTARRKGWVGCNILLGEIPSQAIIAIVMDGQPASPERVREEYRRLRPLQDLSYEKRGWTLDVLRVLELLEKSEFSLGDVYAHGDELRRLHPKNLHVNDKIRQQLQRLRDLGFIEFLGEGKYCFKGSSSRALRQFR